MRKLQLYIIERKIYVLLGAFFFLFFQNTKAQDSFQLKHFIGIYPSLTVEPFYKKGEFDINILPLVYQRNMSKSVDLRISNILNLGVRSANNKISHVGFEIATPVYIEKRNADQIYSRGFFVAPIMSITRNNISSNNTIGLWIEPGYLLPVDDKFVISFGMQTGASYFIYDTGVENWMSHFGVKVIFAKWIN